MWQERDRGDDRWAFRACGDAACLWGCPMHSRIPHAQREVCSCTCDAYCISSALFNLPCNLRFGVHSTVSYAGSGLRCKLGLLMQCWNLALLSFQCTWSTAAHPEIPLFFWQLAVLIALSEDLPKLLCWPMVPVSPSAVRCGTNTLKDPHSPGGGGGCRAKKGNFKGRGGGVDSQSLCHSGSTRPKS